MANGSLDSKDVAIAALVNLVRLMGAELVAGRHRDDPDLLERAVRSKLAAFVVEDCPADVRQAGIDLAADQLSRALKQIRAQRAAIDSGNPSANAIDGTVESKFLH